MASKRFAEYLRKSRADDPNESVEEVLRKHRELLDDLQRKNEIVVLPEDRYEEVVSGDSLYARPQMLRLLEAVERGEYEAVLCMDIQRLGRGSMSDQGAILDAFKYSGTKIITPNKTYDLSNELDETYTEFETFMGRQELRMIKKRLQRGKMKTIEDGGYCANAPYGYERTYIDRKPTLKIVETEANFVRMIFDLYANGGIGCNRIADHINLLGAKPRRGEKFAKSTIMHILRNPVYIGKVAWYRERYIQAGTRGNDKRISMQRPQEEWKVIEGIHQPIIEQDLFDKVQTRLAERTHKPRFTGVVHNPLAGIVRCAHCGALMQRQGCKGGPILICLNRSCNVASKLEYVEEAILQQLKEELALLKVSLRSGVLDAPRQDFRKRELSLLDGEIRKLRGQLTKLHDLVEQGVYDIPTFVLRRDELQDKIGQLEAKKAELREDDGRPQNTEKLYNAICGMLDYYPTATPDERNAMLKSILEKVTYAKQRKALPREFQLVMYLKAQY